MSHMSYKTFGHARLTCDPSIPTRKGVWTVVLRMDGFQVEPPCGGIFCRYPVKKIPALASWILDHGLESLQILVDLESIPSNDVGTVTGVEMGQLLQVHDLVLKARRHVLNERINNALNEYDRRTVRDVL